MCTVNSNSDMKTASYVANGLGRSREIIYLCNVAELALYCVVAFYRAPTGVVFSAQGFSTGTSVNTR